MKTFFNTALTLAAVTTLSLSASAAMASPANTDATASATVITPLTIAVTTDTLNFGSFTKGAGGTVDTATNTYTGVLAVGTAGTTTAVFDVTGADLTYGISAKDGASGTGTANVVTLSNGTHTMTATLTVPPTGINSSGASSFNVDGELTVVGNESDGSYSGTYNVEVTYQ